jgi:hypothetical protein
VRIRAKPHNHGKKSYRLAAIECSCRSRSASRRCFSSNAASVWNRCASATKRGQTTTKANAVSGHAFDVKSATRLCRSGIPNVLVPLKSLTSCCTRHTPTVSSPSINRFRTHQQDALSPVSPCFESTFDRRDSQGQCFSGQPQNAKYMRNEDTTRPQEQAYKVRHYLS